MQTEAFFNTIYLSIDLFLIRFYRWSDHPIIGYMTGTLILTMMCAVLGRMTFFAARRFNSRYLGQSSQDMIHMHNLSIYALVAKDKKSYKACNRQANDAFGKYFFANAALGMASLWPVPFALAWMHTRFADVDFLLPFHLPLIGGTVGYTFSFIPIYILSHMLSGKIIQRMPQFNQMSEGKLEKDAEALEPMISITDLMSAVTPSPRPSPPREKESIPSPLWGKGTG